MMTPHEFGIDTLARPHFEGKTSGVRAALRDKTKGYANLDDTTLEARASEFTRMFSVSSGYKMTVAGMAKMTAGYVCGYNTTMTNLNSVGA